MKRPQRTKNALHVHLLLQDLLEHSLDHRIRDLVHTLDATSGGLAEEGDRILHQAEQGVLEAQ